MTYKHPSGLNLSSIPGDEVLDIEPNDELFSGKTGDVEGAATALAIHAATAERKATDYWMRTLARLLSEYYAAAGVPRVATYDRGLGKITTRNSTV